MNAPLSSNPPKTELAHTHPDCANQGAQDMWLQHNLSNGRSPSVESYLEHLLYLPYALTPLTDLALAEDKVPYLAATEVPVVHTYTTTSTLFFDLENTKFKREQIQE